MRDSALHDELKSECARLARIRELPEERQAPYQAGILKLERRIEELRAACDMTLDHFARQFAFDVMQARLSPDEALKVDYDALWDYTYMASEAWKRGDIDALNETRAGIRRIAFQTKTAEEGTA